MRWDKQRVSSNKTFHKGIPKAIGVSVITIVSTHVFKFNEINLKEKLSGKYIFFLSHFL